MVQETGAIVREIRDLEDQVGDDSEAIPSKKETFLIQLIVADREREEQEHRRESREDHGGFEPDEG